MYNVYDRGDAILIQIKIKKWKSKCEYEYCDPDSIKITISEKSTKKIDNQDMEKDGTNTGYYYYIWQSLISDNVGNYDVEITTTAGSYSEKTKGVIKLR